MENYTGGVIIRLELTVEYGIPLLPVLEKVQREMAQVIEHMTAINVLKVNVVVKHIHFSEKS